MCNVCSVNMHQRLPWILVDFCCHALRIGNNSPRCLLFRTLLQPMHTAERGLYVRERNDGLYSVTTYLLVRGHCCCMHHYQACQPPASQCKARPVALCDLCSPAMPPDVHRASLLMNLPSMQQQAQPSQALYGQAFACRAGVAMMTCDCLQLPSCSCRYVCVCV